MSFIRLTGQVQEVRRILSTGAQRFDRGVRVALLREAQHLRGKMITGIASGAPGGVAFKPLSPVTIAVRKFMGFGGSKALIHTGALRGSISVVTIPGGTGIGGAVFVGVHRSARRPDGKSMVNIADIHEFGRSWTMPFTIKMRRFLMAALAAAGAQGGPAVRGADGRFKRGKYAAKSSGGILTMNIPARPFVRPTWDAYGQPDAVAKRFVFSLANSMGGDFGKP